MKKIILILMLGIFLIAGCNNNTQIANPASVYCIQHGGKSINGDCKNVGTEKEGWYSVLTNEPIELKVCGVPEGSQKGYCFFSDGSMCDEWAFYRRECNKTESI